MKKIFRDKKLTIAPLSAKDLKCAREYTDFINDLITEGAKLLMNKKQTLKEEQGWVINVVKKVKNKEKVFLIARDGKKVVGNVSFESMTFRKNHIARMGIAIRQGYRGNGLGKYLMSEIMKLAKKQLKVKPKIFQLEVYENNKPAIALYKKMGFKIVGKVPKQIQYGGKLIGEYIMIKEVK
ncbi:MAG: GNAT family N-acetyltransferase [Candidatus Staskawiczbacteria bacterium]|nr:GNAT family N-acetyltransferase [Candidatus Staskawiczbacteria bacterium]